MLSEIETVVSDSNLEHPTHLVLQRNRSRLHVIQEICIQGDLLMVFHLDKAVALGTL